ncbi:Fe-S protein assembly co-chaperone HscB [Endozoicomonas sp. Mp262]|uniref:Fe-S protein assembly co-chaperone HscB n=1 Tax=Endozoicomonas sp. Mp262 TaxID=2919499 RepID=UPI0021D9F0E7
MDITQNYFELFQLPVSCQLDHGKLALKYRELQKTVHPDRFAGDAHRQQRLSVQYAAYVNEAFDTLKLPLKRFIYLLNLAGLSVDMEQNTVMDPEFLMEQMALREQMAELRGLPDPEAGIDRLINAVEDSLDELSEEFERLWVQGQSEHLKQAETVVQKMQFMVKVAAELEQLESELLD